MNVTSFRLEIQATLIASNETAINSSLDPSQKMESLIDKVDSTR